MNTDLNFIFKDERIFAIAKPSGIHTVFQGKSEAPSVAGQLLELIPSLAEVSDRSGDAGLINRLDFETSGILIGAFARECWLTLRKMIQEGEIKKSYLALVEGNLKKSVNISNWIGSPNRGAKKVRVFETEPRKKDRALPASTQFEAVKFHESDDISLVRVTCATARRHQIRAHAAFIGHPLVGDKLYGSLRELPNRLPPAIRSFFLHAEYAEFPHPISQRSIVLRVAAAAECYSST